ncbi:hypothetical protein B7494_g8624 [Chlorociboria aeruginascens]|nr:hypothetical protein B7494_g8624 [Chlorociboria aeruginascens]
MGIRNGCDMALSYILHCVYRFIQFVLALTVIGLYGVDLNNAHKHGKYTDGKWVYAVVTASLSAFTALIYGIPFVSHIGLLFIWDTILFILWIALFGLFGNMYIKENAEGDSGITRMKHAVWVDLVNALLWLFSAIDVPYEEHSSISTLRVGRCFLDQSYDDTHSQTSIHRGSNPTRLNSTHLFIPPIPFKNPKNPKKAKKANTSHTTASNFLRNSFDLNNFSSPLFRLIYYLPRDGPTLVDGVESVSKMAGRSLKTASYLASQPSRPSFTRTSSSSSNKSEDSILATIRQLSTSAYSENKEVSGGESAAVTPANSAPSSQEGFLDTPGRKRSAPIAIELPRSNQPVYTPLSARGDVSGGYFPNHEEIHRQYKTHPFEDRKKTESPIMSACASPLFFEDRKKPESPIMSACTSPLEITPRAPVSVPECIPEVIRRPQGKYYPGNYETNPTTPTPTTTNNLQIPTKKSRTNHNRHPSDVKRAIQQYQRDMIEQARIAAAMAKGSGKPISPRLAPKALGSPGIITPLDLEVKDGDGGYLERGGVRDGGLVEVYIEEERRRVSA